MFIRFKELKRAGIQATLSEINSQPHQNNDFTHHYRNNWAIQHQIKYIDDELDLLVKVSDLASKMIGTTANLKQGTWIILKDLLYGVMLPSGNDAAYLLAEIIGFVYTASQKCENSEIFSTIEKIDLT